MGQAISDIAVRLPKSYDVARLQSNLAAIGNTPAAAQPGPYHDGEWTGISLYSQGGRPGAMPEAAGLEPYQPTEVLSRTPYFKEILDDLECPKQVVRLLKLPPGAEIGTHFDYDTNFQYGLIRLHLPIVTHADVDFTISNNRCYWQAGELWYGDFSLPHYVKNNSPVTRVHLVADVEINDFLLRLFPDDFVERRRKEGISMYVPPLSASTVDLTQYICDFFVPGEILPALTIGKSLASLVRGASGSVAIADGTLTVSLNGEPAFALEPLDERSTFGIVGLPRGCTFEFGLADDRVSALTFVLKGAPDDLYAARLGDPSGEKIRERRISLPLIEGGTP